jgi:hypothetical protein
MIKLPLKSKNFKVDFKSVLVFLFYFFLLFLDLIRGYLVILNN